MEKKVPILDLKVLDGVEEDLKDIKEADPFLIERKVDEIKNDKLLIKELIEYRAKKTFSTIKEKGEIEDSILETDLSIIKELINVNFDFDSIKIDLNYDPNTVEEPAHLIGLLNKYEEEIRKVKSDKYILYKDKIGNNNIVEEIENMKNQKQLSDSVAEIMNEEIDNKSKTI